MSATVPAGPGASASAVSAASAGPATAADSPDSAASADSARSARRPRRRRRRPRPGRVISSAIAVVFALVWVFPAYWMVNTAFKRPQDVTTPTPQFWPHHPTWTNVRAAVTQSHFLGDLRNSLIVVAGTLAISILLGIFASAALSRFRFRGRRALLVVILAVQMLPSTALLIPMYLVFNEMHLLGTYAGLVLAYVAAVLPFSIWVMRGFFLALPYELEEAAMIDGANTRQILFRILFPLVTPGIIATSIFAFVYAWNDYLVAYTFMKDQSRYTLPVWLASFSTPTTGTNYGGQMAASALFSLPVVIFFLAIQRNLVSGMSAGAVKG
ncbi:MAG: carbohydrate ABC transporter permease [Nocardioides sp.]|uniref:carbohydrate ABC transporter permease n=1 Tax=Nocardioides sp. TaxID=35761 RepID=UPI0039E40E9E